MHPKLHPSKYIEQMSAALVRVEAIARLPTAQRELSLLREFEGVSERDAARSRDILVQFEPMMAEWRDGGSTSYDAEFILNEFAGSQISPYRIDGETFGPSPVYVHFGATAQLDLESDSSCHIDGMYFQPSYLDGRAGLELTFVCDEPAWKDMASLPYGRVLNAAARIAIGFLPFEETGPNQVGPQWIGGDPSLLVDEAIGHACGVANLVLGVLSALAHRTRIEPTGLIRSTKFLH